MENIKKQAKKQRDGLQQFIYKVINPFVRFMIRIGITPNMVTTIGFLGSVAAAVLFVLAAHPGGGNVFDYMKSLQTGKPISYSLIGWGGGIMILFALFDMLDGQVARLGNMTSTFGAMYDSVLDRYSELFTLGGISYMMISAGYWDGGLITFAALIGSIMVSYVRARAEGLDIECKIGFMQRPERVVVTSVAALVTGIVGYCSSDFDAMQILIWAMGIIAVFANLTAFARLRHCYKELSKKDKGF